VKWKFSVGTLIGALIFCGVVAGQAGATVYNVDIDVGPTNVSGTSTTDGTTGTLHQSNIMPPIWFWIRPAHIRAIQLRVEYFARYLDGNSDRPVLEL
jgi:hypothetical protein